jgi:nitrous oxidase accessory protein NosD
MKSMKNMKTEWGKPERSSCALCSSWLILVGLMAAAVQWSVGAATPQGAQTRAQGVLLTAGMTIDRSMRVAPGWYRMETAPDAAAPGAPAITIRGENITVDLTGVTIEGGDPVADPDGYHGVGIFVDGGRGVTLRGGTIRGYKVGVLARRSPALHITGLDASYNWKPRLYSGIEKESLADWLSHHDNEKDEWLRYGAAIYLAECDDAEIDNSRAVQGQNGLLVTRSAHLTIWNNTFSWLSGLGLGLYRTTDSTVMHNRLDWDVRGYSHGFYRRGQDSAALLMYEQSSRNTVAYNSATHGGDGLFLWAGQSTMDTAKGGSNDNVFFGNDFSHAVANGIEATFSRNQFARNRIDDCWHGVWAGYSYDTAFRDNAFEGNEDAIAIEHGQNITIADNTFVGDQTAIRLWANPSQDPNWGYPKNRDTRSRDYLIQQNAFTGEKTAVSVLRTTNIRIQDNAYVNTPVPLQMGVEVAGLLFEPPATRSALPSLADVPRRAGAMDAMLPVGAPRGRQTIIVDDWGPYDYQSPKIWPAGKTADRPLKLRVLGPQGKWTLQSSRGGIAEPRSGVTPGEITVTPAGPGLDLDLQFEYVGAPVTTPRGRQYPAGAVVPFSYSLVEPAVSWAVKWWVYDATSDPLTAPAAFSARLRGDPFLSEAARPKLDFLSSGALVPGLPPDRVAMRAETTVQVPAGGYDLQVLSDDGVRVWVDGAIAIDRWTVHETQVDHATLAAGTRRIRIDYFDAAGWAELQVSFARR